MLGRGRRYQEKFIAFFKISCRKVECLPITEKNIKTHERHIQIQCRCELPPLWTGIETVHYAIYCAHMLSNESRGKNAENTKLHNTLSNDHLKHMRFKLQFVNTNHGYDWSKDEAAVTAEAARGFEGRFGAGLPRKSDGQMHVQQYRFARMNELY